MDEEAVAAEAVAAAEAAAAKAAKAARHLPAAKAVAAKLQEAEDKAVAAAAERSKLKAKIMTKGPQSKDIKKIREIVSKIEIEKKEAAVAAKEAVAKAINIAEAVICGSDEVFPFITSFISENDNEYYRKATESFQSYLIEEQSKISRRLKQENNLLRSKMEIQERILEGFNTDKEEASVPVEETKETNEAEEQRYDKRPRIKKGGAAGEMDVEKIRTKLNHQQYVGALKNENEDGIENVYASLSAKFNDYIYSFLQDICNKSVENNLTIIQVFKYLPNEIKLLVYLTNIIVDDEEEEKRKAEEEKRKAEGAAMEVEKQNPTMFYSERYGTQIAMSDAIYHIIIKDEKWRKTKEMKNIYGNIIDIVEVLTIKEIHIYVILFFGAATKYYINEENKYELEITKYIDFDIQISYEVDQLLKYYGGFPSMNPIDKLRVLLQIYFVGVTHPSVRTGALGGAKKTRKKNKSSKLRKTIKKRILKKIKRKSIRRRKPIKKRVNSKNRKVKRKIKNKTKKYKKHKKKKRSRKPKPKP